MNNTKVKDFRQKDRSRPIDITDIAISKVPQTRIPGFSTEQNEFIQDMHKELLRRAQYLNRINNSKKMEVGILIDIHTWQSWVIDGRKECEVEMQYNPLAVQNLQSASKNSRMFMHNHPSTGTFSGEDVKMFCNHDTLYMMTVIGNDASVYILIKDINFDSELVLKDYMKFAIKYLEKGYTKNNGTLAIRDVLNNASKYELIYKKGRHKV